MVTEMFFQTLKDLMTKIHYLNHMLARTNINWMPNEAYLEKYTFRPNSLGFLLYSLSRFLGDDADASKPKPLALGGFK